MNPPPPKPKPPIMVKLGLWGLPNAGSAWFCFFLSVALAIACTIYGFVDPIFFIGAGFLLSAWWYFAAIQWVNRHGGWPKWF